MNVTLKPFDFAQAVARAGLGIDGVPLAKGGAAAAGGSSGFQGALGQALTPSASRRTTRCRCSARSCSTTRR